MWSKIYSRVIKYFVVARHKIFWEHMYWVHSTVTYILTLSCINFLLKKLINCKLLSDVVNDAISRVKIFKLQYLSASEIKIITLPLTFLVIPFSVHIYACDENKEGGKSRRRVHRQRMRSETKRVNCDGFAAPFGWLWMGGV